MTTLAEVINHASARAQNYKDRRIRLTESDTIRVLVLPVLDALGWDLHDVEEVRSEYRHASADNPVDYALFLCAIPSVFVEAKALGVSLDDRKPLLQTLNYANAAGVNWCVLTNGTEWRIYKVHAPVAAEEKLFLSVRLDEKGVDTGNKVATLSLLSGERMRARAIDALWSEWSVDRKVERILDLIPEDEAFIRLITKRVDGLTAGEVRGSLRRSGLRSSYPDVDTFVAQLAEQPNSRADVLLTLASLPPEGPISGTVMGLPAPKVRKRLMKTGEMVAQGLLPIGTLLTIKGRPNSAAKVVDGKRVEFRGEVISFNDWGCRVTGWSAIQIYKWAVLPDGHLLKALREGSK